MQGIILIAFTVNCLTITVSKENTLDSRWGQFKLKYEKRYGQREDVYRRDVWKKNVARIAAHNELYVKGLVTFYLGENQFTDWTTQEFDKHMNGHRISKPNTSKTYAYPFNVSKVYKTNTNSSPSEVNWVKRGYVTKVKDQGDCGASWAFAATGAMEGAHFKKAGRLVSLSEKNLMDCSWNYGNAGCAGGSVVNAFRYAIENTGVDTEDSYPYYPFNDVTCHFNASSVGASFNGYKEITFGSELELQESVTKVGPLAVMVDADHFSFMTYEGGLYNEPGCSSLELNHGMLVVGYGTFGGGKDFWLVKNSFGPTWGESGYIKMSRNKQNQCGIASSASYPVL